MVQLQYVATTVNSLGSLDHTENRRAQARERLQEAQQIQRQPAQTNGAVYLTALAAVLNLLGHVDHDENRRVQARDRYEEALQMGHQLALAKEVRNSASIRLVMHHTGQMGTSESAITSEIADLLNRADMEMYAAKQAR